MSLAAIALSAGLALSPQQADIAALVVGEGKPACIAYAPDDSPAPCRPVFAVTAGVHVNAWADGDHIRFSRAAVLRLTPAEFALLTAHEVAHYFLGHETSTVAFELAADRLGAELACRAGFRPEEGVSMLRFLAAGEDHPPRDLRRAVILAVRCDLPAQQAQHRLAARPSPAVAP